MSSKENQKVLIRFVRAECNAHPQEADCPVRNETEVEVKRDGSGEYNLFQFQSTEYPDLPGIGEFFAACPICHSHRHVKIVEK